MPPWHLLQFSKNMLKWPKVIQSNFSRGRSSCDVAILQDRFRYVMKNVPQSVMVVTSALWNAECDHWIKRGVTCSSFTSISMKPPIVSFAISKKSRMHGLMMDADNFAIHVLAKNQVAYGLHFSKPVSDDTDQFQNIPHEMDQQGIPILRDSCGVMLCEAHSIHTIGDHHVWYGEVKHAYCNSHIAQEPLLFYAKSFRSVGDETFIRAFEDATLPFSDWTHEAHIRMAWNYIREFGKEKAIPNIKSGIQHYNSQNEGKISRGYHETVTMFYISVISKAMERSPEVNTFEEFLSQNPHIYDKHLLFEFYSDELLNDQKAKFEFLPPDKKSLSQL